MNTNPSKGDGAHFFLNTLRLYNSPGPQQHARAGMELEPGWFALRPFHSARDAWAMRTSGTLRHVTQMHGHSPRPTSCLYLLPLSHVLIAPFPTQVPCISCSALESWSSVIRLSWGFAHSQAKHTLLPAAHQPPLHSLPSCPTCHSLLEPPKGKTHCCSAHALYSGLGLQLCPHTWPHLELRCT